MLKLQTDLIEPQLLAAPEPLVVHYLPGTGRRLVVSLAGVGRMPGYAPPMEFVGTASGGGENHVLFISDVSRSWMNGPGVADAIAGIVERCVRNKGIEELVTLGNSMGGFAAVVLADLLPVDTVIAMSPQYSMHRDLVPEEDRWDRYTRNIRHWRYPGIGQLDAAGTTYFVFHGDVNGEAPHWARFPLGQRIYHYIVQNSGHNVARKLQKRQRLVPVVNAAMARRPRKVRLTLERSFSGRAMRGWRREAYEQEFPQIAAQYGNPGGQAPLAMEDRQ